jgi:DNA-binding NarL/FixJ family response regulator
MIADINNLGAPIAASKRSGGEPGGRRTLRLWLVDDNDSIRAIVKDNLELDSRIRCERDFDNPQSVLQALVEEPTPDLILLDIRMGPFNGLDAVLPIRRLAPGARILMFTTFYDSECEARALRDGALGLLLKGSGTEHILEKIFWAVEQPVVAPALDDILMETENRNPRKEVKRISMPAAPARGSLTRVSSFWDGVKDFVLGRSNATQDS